MSSSSHRSRAESALREYSRRVAAGESPDAGAFVAAQPAELRSQVRALIDDYDFLRRAETAPPAPGSLLGDFRLTRVLGRGGMGVVWEAEQLSLGRRVALKLLNGASEASPLRVKRFLREAEAGARLNHPGVVAVIAAGEHAGTYFLAQELVPGGRTLADWIGELRASGERSAEHYRAVAELFRDLATALHAAHEAGVVHRDIKPGNVLLTEQGRAKLGDFGLALVAGTAALTRTGEHAGTPFYMSPEQAAAGVEEIDARSDVFSLGATLYEVLALARPFEGDTGEQVLEKIRSAEPLDPRVVRSRVPRDLAVICLKALEKQPGQRFPSAAALAADLDRFLRGEPIRARPPGALARAAKWARRHPVLSSTGAVLLAALAVVTHLLLENRAARIEASRQAELARRRARTNDRVVEFLVGLFEVPDPGRSLGRSVTAKEVLDRGVATIGSELAGEPEIQSALLETMGRVYMALALYREAEPLLARALELRRELSGDDAPETLAALGDLAALRARSGRLEEAEATLLDLERRWRARPDGEPARVARTLGELAWIQLERGRTEDAERTLTRVFELARDDGAVGRAARRAGELLLASVRVKQGRFDEAEALLRKIVDLDRGALPPAHPQALDARASLVDVLLRRARFTEAEGLLASDVDLAEMVFGARHPLALAALANLGRLSADQGRLDQAEGYFARALEGLREIYGDEHDETLTAMVNLALVYQREWCHEASEPLLEHVIRTRRRALGPHDPSALSALASLAVGRAMQGRPAEAEALFREVVEGCRAALGETHPQTVAALGNLALALRDLGRLDESIELLETALRGLTSAYGAEHPKTLAMHQNLADVYSRAGRHELALCEAARAVDLAAPERHAGLQSFTAALRARAAAAGVELE